MNRFNLTFLEHLEGQMFMRDLFCQCNLNKKKNLFGVNVFLVNYPFKGVVHSTMKMCLKCTHPKACQHVHNFIFLLEQIWRNLALHHLLTNGCFAGEWVPSE